MTIETAINSFSANEDVDSILSEELDNAEIELGAENEAQRDENI